MNATNTSFDCSRGHPRLGTRPGRHSTNGGFTLIELLVVIGIIAFLLSIGLTATTNVLGVSKAAATRATILKVDNAIRGRFDAVVKRRTRMSPPELQKINDQARELAVNGLGIARADLDDLFGSALTRDAIVNLHLLKKTLPQSFDPYELGVPAANNPLIVAAGANYIAANHKPETEGAALLHFLILGQSGGNVDDETPTFSTSEVADTDGDGLLEIIDAWGQPLRVYRWPTRLLRLQRPATDATASLPISDAYSTGSDLTVANASFARMAYNNLPQTSLLVKSNYDSLGGLLGWIRQGPDQTEEDRRLRLVERLFCTPQTYSQFMIMSAGPDTRLGLREPHFDVGTPLASNSPCGCLGSPECTDVTNTAEVAAALEAASDNLTNYNSR